MFSKPFPCLISNPGLQIPTKNERQKDATKPIVHWQINNIGKQSYFYVEEFDMIRINT